jgi:Short C-terminal domain
MRRRGIGRAGRPSLMGTAARTAVIAGTATAVSGRMAARQQQAGPQQPAAADTPATGALTDDVVDQLMKLGKLRDAGILTDEEFASKKSKLLGI